jgi:hypothetical protein
MNTPNQIMTHTSKNENKASENTISTCKGQRRGREVTTYQVME